MITNEAELKRAPFGEGEVALAYDRRYRRYRVELKQGSLLETHLGYVSHDDIIGRPEGFFLRTNKGHRLLILRPIFGDAVRELPRQSQVIYPKDLGSLLVHTDIYPGANVIEVGLGSGATSAALLRAVGESGTVTSYEIREEIVEASKKNVAELAPGASHHRIIVRDCYAEGLEQSQADRIVIDVPEPWRLLETSASALRFGGILCAFLPTVLQVHELMMHLTRDNRWHMASAVEILERPWHFSETSARPEHRMVGHTGFITIAHRCEPPPAQDQEA